MRRALEWWHQRKEEVNRALDEALNDFLSVKMPLQNGVVENGIKENEEIVENGTEEPALLEEPKAQEMVSSQSKGPNKEQ